TVRGAGHRQSDQPRWMAAAHAPVGGHRRIRQPDAWGVQPVRLAVRSATPCLRGARLAGRARLELLEPPCTGLPALLRGGGRGAVASPARQQPGRRLTELNPCSLVVCEGLISKL